MSLQALADKMGRSRQLVWQWENGESDPRKHIEALSKHLEVPVEYFYGTMPAENLIEKKFLLLSPPQRDLIERMMDSLLGEETPKAKHAKKV